MFFIPGIPQVMGNEVEANLRFSQAEDSLKSAYLSVLKAEMAGGDISDLVTYLNNAIELYSEAKKAFNSEEYTKAVLITDNVIEISSMIFDDAVSLRSVAELHSEVAFRNQLLISLGAICSIVVLSFLCWRRFKDYYLQKMMKMRPEVVVDES